MELFVVKAVDRPNTLRAAVQHLTSLRKTADHIDWEYQTVFVLREDLP